MAGNRKIILLIESSRASGRDLLSGIAAYARHHGPWSFFWKASGFEKASAETLEPDADGIITRDFELTDEFVARGLPAVVVGHSRGELEGVANVVTDSEAVGRMAAEHLLGCGFSRFAFCGYSDCSWSDVRFQSFSQRLTEAGFATERFSVRAEITGMPWKGERKSITPWLRKLSKPIGLLACNDDLGHEVIEACKLEQFTVPDDVGVIGVDNDEIVCGLSDPPLSSVALNFERAGYEAARLLNRLMEGASRQKLRIPVPATHVVARRSTDFVAVDDPLLKKALRYVRDNSLAGIPVSAVARAAGLSRRALELRFRRVIGHSILNEIRRLRTDHIARMLVETDLPVAQIADSLGFEDVQHVARYFRSARQTSPLAYRKAYGWRRSDF
jgi:LacI family transcriptional regulator